MSRIESAITSAVTDQIVDAIKAPGISLTSAMPFADAGVIARAVSADVAPVVQNLTNNEPWYQSRVTWGALIGGLIPILALFGYNITAEQQVTILNGIMALAPLIGMGLALYGRYVGKKPIGA